MDYFHIHGKKDVQQDTYAVHPESALCSECIPDHVAVFVTGNDHGVAILVGEDILDRVAAVFFHVSLRTFGGGFDDLSYGMGGAAAGCGTFSNDFIVCHG